MFKRWAGLVFVLAMGCSATNAAAGVAGAVQASLTVLRDVRNTVCTTKLDPFMGNPREGQAAYEAAPDAGTTSDGGGDL